MRVYCAIAFSISVFSAGFQARPTTAEDVDTVPAIVQASDSMSVQSAALSEGVKVDTKASEKPIRVILPSPYEIASR